MVNAGEAAAFAELSRCGVSAMEAAGAILLSREVDLAEAVWKHELRGPGGKWARGNPVVHPAVAALSPGRAHQSGLALAPQQDPSVKSAMDRPATMRHLAHAQMQTMKIAQDAAKTAAAHAVQQAIDIHTEAERTSDIQRTKDANRKLISVALGLIGGAVVGLITAGLGLPATYAILLALTPSLAEAAYERKYRL